MAELRQGLFRNGFDSYGGRRLDCTIKWQVPTLLWKGTFMNLNLVLELIVTAAMVVLYGLAWHDKPAHEPVPLRRTTRKH